MAFNPEALKKSLNNRAGNNEFWKPTADKTTIRILPPKGKGVELPWVGILMHFKLPLSQGPVVCGKTINKDTGKFEGSCPVCDYVSKLYKSGNAEDVELARQIKASPHYYANILDKSDGSPEISLKPKVYRFGKLVKEQLEECFTRKLSADGTVLTGEDLVDADLTAVKTDIEDISHPKTGKNIRIIKGTKVISEKQTITTYVLQKGGKPAPILNEQAVMNLATDLTKYLVKSDKLELQKNLKFLLGQPIEEQDLKEDEIDMCPPENSEYTGTTGFDEE
jgi:hypothetical protein